MFKFLRIIFIAVLLFDVQSSLAFPGSVTITGQPNITASPLPTGDPSVYEWKGWSEYEKQELQEKLSWPNRNEILENYARPRPPAVYQTFEEDNGIVVWVCIGAISVIVLGIIAVLFLDAMDMPSKYTYADYKCTQNILKHLNTNNADMIQKIKKRKR